jgi:UDP-N-acetylenolpyruvoylglucosamine reductase
MELIQLLTKKNIPFEENVSLSKKTWIKTGGVCGCWIMPNSVEQLEEVSKYLYANCIKFDLVGQTSNIFFHSTYNPQVVVSTVKVNGYKTNGDTVFCECGVSVVKLAKDCLSRGYAGFYGLVGLPGTVASAAVNNAGCFNCSISSMLISAEVLLPDGTTRTFLKEDFHYGHRSSSFKRGEKNGIILSLKLKLEKASNLQDEYRKSEETKQYRKKYQEKPSWCLGSVFSDRIFKKNIRNKFVSLLSRLSLKCGWKNQAFLNKTLMLFLYGYFDLLKYVSDKNLNTFIWRDAEAEMKFERYKKFMNEVHSELTMEIEEKKYASINNYETIN